ncbi:uncharacterized protein BDZ99DRAFT_476416 [Mytilinidion resinicola]|uniref:Ubiquitin-like domain-containing protein n=1 Tax=Mytilinidion resinicola TaxID=574789 RepID=A0A6A6YNB2_9PEZI|nr:uncharacterized protein BDZ99DRAFT_476416 [Mytilinidion resinicola]KAF2810231.1 hypothetical protein BDZ99DRAFT_476416 [Mytilinidion resinicola]
MANAATPPLSVQTPKPAKRSFFKRPAWATAEETKSETPQTGSESFRHSSRVFAEIVEEQKKKDEEKARQKEKEERRKKRKSEESERHAKRRRASGEGEGSESPAHRSPREGSSRTPQLTSPRRATRSNIDSTSLSARYEEALRPSVPRDDIFASHIIDLGDDTDDSDDSSRQPVLHRQPTPIILEDDDDMEPILEPEPIALQMRERDPQAESSRNPPPIVSSAPIPNPVVKLFISSPIEGTTPLIATRKLLQPLGDVRTAWCAKQIFPPGITPSMIFLTYRKRRLFDVATCKSSIGLEVDAHGNLKPKHDHDDFDDEMEDRVHLVAVTEEILVEMKRRAELGIHESEPAEEVVEEEEEVVKEQPKCRLILKAKGIEDFKLAVKPETTFKDIANAFRRHNKMPDTRQITLFFDGDHLEPQDMIKGSDIEDMDAIEVHIK